MAIKDQFKDKKVAKHHVKRVLMLLEISQQSFLGSETWIKIHEDELRMAEEANAYADPDDYSALQTAIKERMALYFAIFAQELVDLYEFFYFEEKRAGDTGYYYFQLPIDRKKFEKQRVPEDEMLDAMSKIKKSKKVIIKYTQRNIDVFYECLEMKVEKPTIKGSKKIIDDFLNKYNKVRKARGEKEIETK